MYLSKTHLEKPTPTCLKLKTHKTYIDIMRKKIKLLAFFS